MMTGLDKLEEFTICSVNEFDLFSSVQFMCCGQALSGGQPFDRSRRQVGRVICQLHVTEFASSESVYLEYGRRELGRRGVESMVTERDKLKEYDLLCGTGVATWRPVGTFCCQEASSSTSSC